MAERSCCEYDLTHLPRSMRLYLPGTDVREVSQSPQSHKQLMVEQ